MSCEAVLTSPDVPTASSRSHSRTARRAVIEASRSSCSPNSTTDGRSQLPQRGHTGVSSYGVRSGSTA